MVRTDFGAPPSRTICPRCNQESDLIAKVVRPWFTVFFLPVFPIGAGQRFTQCSRCGGQFPLAPEQLRQHLEQNDQATSQEAISLYNSLRASPANSITLNQLMLMYASMKEYAQAIGAAADFPQALHASEQCMSTLGRVYLAQNDLDNALRWFDAAITRNPQLGEAHFHKAIALLSKTPPEAQRAVASARVARNLSFPNADALLNDAQAKARGE